LVEVSQRIPYRDEAKLRLAAHGGEPSAPSRVFDERPLRWAPLTSLPAREATSVRGTAKKRMKRDENTLDSAADVIHGKWQSPREPMGLVPALTSFSVIRLLSIAFLPLEST